MRIVLIGPPGAGKGTQSALLAEHLGIPHLSTGEILRAANTAHTEIGCQAVQYMNRGELVPDEMIQEIVFEELSQPVCDRGYILDGFPRTVPQAEKFDAWLKQNDSALSVVLEFRVSEAVLLKRLSERGREDDAQEVVRQRMKQYNKLTQPLLDYYQDQDMLHVVNGDQGSVEEVFAAVLNIIDNLSDASRLRSSRGTA